MKKRVGRSIGVAALTGAYRPGASVIHRAPLWLKAVALVVLSVGVLVSSSPAVLAGGVVLLAGLYALAGLLDESWRPLEMMWPVLVLLGAFQWWASGPATAVEVTGSIVVCVAAARLLTLTTPLHELLDGLGSLVRPLRRFGADPERFALALALMVRSIPYLFGSAGEMRQSAMARGLERSPRALAVPVVIRAVAYAQQTGEALEARGLGERTRGMPPESKHA